MRILLLVCCFVGLAYCIFKIFQIIFEFLIVYRVYRFANIAFNIQYKILRSFLTEDLSSDQIIQKVRDKDPKYVEAISINEGEIAISIVKDKHTICKDTADIRSVFLKEVYVLEKIRDFFELYNIEFREGVYDENQDFIKELKEIRLQKGETTVYEEEEEGYEDDEE